MHVIVGQGQLDQVLHATAEERRGFIEEAAGILKHRRRKEKTLRKLEAMQANLTRLSDLAGEIRRQLKPLGQQAEIAREAQTIAAIVRDARARLLADEVVELRASIDVVSRSESERKTERLVLQEQLDQAKLRQTRIEQTMSGDAVDDARRVAFGLEQVQDHLRSLFTLANQRLALLGQQAELPGMTTTISPRMIEEAREEAERLASGVGEAEEALGRTSAATATAKGSLDSLDEEISEQSALVSQHDLEQGRLAGLVNAAESRRAATHVELERSRTALDEAEQRREDARAELLALEGADGGAVGRRRARGSGRRGRGRGHRACRPRSRRCATSCTPPSASATRSPPAPAPSRSPSTRKTARARSSARAASAAWSPSTCRCAPATRPRSPPRSARSPTRCSPTTGMPRSPPSRRCGPAMRAASRSWWRMPRAADGARRTPRGRRGRGRRS